MLISPILPLRKGAIVSALTPGRLSFPRPLQGRSGRTCKSNALSHIRQYPLRATMPRGKSLCKRWCRGVLPALGDFVGCGGCSDDGCGRAVDIGCPCVQVEGCWRPPPHLRLADAISTLPQAHIIMARANACTREPATRLPRLPHEQQQYQSPQSRQVHPAVHGLLHHPGPPSRCRCLPTAKGFPDEPPLH